MLLGVASGDRPDEYPAFGVDFHARGQLFRESFDYLQKEQHDFPKFNNAYGDLHGGMDLMPKQSQGKVSLLVAGVSQQSPDWLAQNGDGWITYPRDIKVQSKIVQQWRQKKCSIQPSL